MELAGYGDEVEGSADGVGGEAVLGSLLALALGCEAVASDPTSQVCWIHLLHGEIKIAPTLKSGLGTIRAWVFTGRWL